MMEEALRVTVGVSLLLCANLNNCCLPKYYLTGIKKFFCQLYNVDDRFHLNNSL